MAKKLTMALLTFLLLFSWPFLAVAAGKHFEDVSIVFFPGGNSEKIGSKLE